MISMFATKVEVKEICGRKFRVVDSGLDEAEVAAFIGSLMDQAPAISHKPSGEGRAQGSGRSG